MTVRLPGGAAASLRGRLTSGTAWAAAGRLLAAPLAVAVASLSSRLLSPEELGTYLLAANLVGIVVTIACLGQDLAVVRFVAEGVATSPGANVRSLVRRVLLLVLGSASIAGIVWVAGGGRWIARAMGAEDLLGVTVLMALWILSLALLHLMAETFRGFHDIRLASLFAASGQSPGIAAGSLLVIGLAGLALLDGRSELPTVVATAVCATAAGAVAAGALLVRRLRALAPREDARSYRELLHTGLPLWVSRVGLFVLLQADLLILAVFRPEAEVAVYGVASRLVAFVGIPLAIANSILPPLIAELNVLGERTTLERLLRGSATITAVPAVLALAVFVLWGRPVLELLYGSAYRTAWAVLVILAVGKVVNVAMGSCGQVLAMTGHERAAMGITVTSGALTLAAAVALAGPFGAVGVASAMAGGLALQNALRLGFARYHLGVWTHVSVSPGHLAELVRSLRRRGGAPDAES